MKIKKDCMFISLNGESVGVTVSDDSSSGNKLIKLNSSGEFVWKLLRNDISYEEIIQKLLEEYELSEDAARVDADEFLSTLRRFDMLDERNDG